MKNWHPQMIPDDLIDGRKAPRMHSHAKRGNENHILCKPRNEGCHQMISNDRRYEINFKDSFQKAFMVI